MGIGRNKRTDGLSKNAALRKIKDKLKELDTLLVDNEVYSEVYQECVQPHFENFMVELETEIEISLEDFPQNDSDFETVEEGNDFNDGD